MSIYPLYFKWSARMVKALVKPPQHKGEKARLIVARDGDEVWHTDGQYLKRGEPHKRLGALEIENTLRVEQIRQIIPYHSGDVLHITGDCEANGTPAVILSNGALVNRHFLAYLMDGYEVVTLKGNGKLHPVCVLHNGEVIGLAMPMLQVY